MLVCQGHRSRLYQDFFMTDTRSLLFICPYGHVFFLMTDRKSSFSHPLHPLYPLLGRLHRNSGPIPVPICSSIMASTRYQIDVLFPCLFDTGLTFLSPGHDQNCEEVTRKSTMAKCPHSASVSRIRAIDVTCASCQ